MPDPESDITIETITSSVGRLMDDAWVDHGYTAPNTEVYPWLWLWDSCFHTLIWADLNRPDRAVAELGCVLELQDGAGFVPHMGYQLDPQVPVDLWGRQGAHRSPSRRCAAAVAELRRRGIDVPDELAERAHAGLRFLVRERARDPESGLITVVHPWETGCDDSPRWDHYCPGSGFDLDVWRRHKIDLLPSLEFGPTGGPLANPAFGAASVSFNALTVWNARELASVTGDDELLADVDALVPLIEDRWDADLATWVDAGPGVDVGPDPHGRPAVCPARGRRHGPTGCSGRLARRLGRSRRRFGPRGVHPTEPMYDPSSYWRGPVWPQLAYLLWRALDRGPAETEVGEELRGRTIAGAVRSGFAEYWDGDSAAGGGATPQSWTGLALVLAKTRTTSPSSSG